MAMKKFNVAVVGCGNVSRMHFEAYRASERMRIVAVCDPLPERIAWARETYNVPQGFDSLPALIAGADWDVAVVCTPTLVREEAVGALAAAGKHIFVEKPLADTYDEALRIVETCERAGVTLAVNQNFRYHYPFDTARQWIAEGRIGAVRGVTQHDLMFRQDAGWRIIAARHALSVMGVHWFDGFRWMLQDEARAIRCETYSSPAIDCVGETDAFTQLTFARGTVVSFVESFSSPVTKTETVVIGETGALRLTYDDLALFDREHRATPTAHWENPYRGTNKPAATRVNIERLFTALEDGTAPPHSGRDNLKTMALLDGAYRSAARGEEVTLDAGVLA